MFRYVQAIQGILTIELPLRFIFLPKIEIMGLKGRTPPSNVSVKLQESKINI